jgi:hypothetical protein
VSLVDANNLRPYTALEMIEEATSRAGIPPYKLTSEHIEKALDQINLLFTQLVNRGIQLWKRQKMILPCYLGTARVPLPSNVNLVDKLTRRSFFRQTGTPFSDSGGNPAYAFDNDFMTFTEQTALNGSIGCIYANPVQITGIGVLFAWAQALTLFFEYSLDGSTNWAALDAVIGTVSDGQWVWVDLDGAPAAKGWRVRSASSGSGAMPFSAREVFFGNMPTEIVLESWNLDEYNAMPNKTAPGRVINWYQQRDLDAPSLLVWPVPNMLAAYDQLVVWVREHLNPLTSPTQDFDVPRRWHDAITAMLARRLCRSLTDADMSRYPILLSEEQDAVSLAEAEERDPSNVNYDLGLSAYTA